MNNFKPFAVKAKYEMKGLRMILIKHPHCIYLQNFSIENRLYSMKWYVLQIFGVLSSIVPKEIVDHD